MATPIDPPAPEVRLAAELLRSSMFAWKAADVARSTISTAIGDADPERPDPITQAHVHAVRFMLSEAVQAWLGRVHGIVYQPEMVDAVVEAILAIPAEEFRTIPPVTPA